MSLLRDLLDAHLRHVALAASLRHDGSGLPSAFGPALILLALIALPLEFLFASSFFPLEPDEPPITWLSFLIGKAITLGLLALVGPLLRAGPGAFIVSAWLLATIPPGLLFLAAHLAGASPPTFLFSAWAMAAALSILLRRQAALERERSGPDA